MPDVPIEKFLRGALKGPEWNYLSRHKTFLEFLEKTPKKLDDYEKLIQTGALLLRQREELIRHRPSLNRAVKK